MYVALMVPCTALPVLRVLAVLCPLVLAPLMFGVAVSTKELFSSSLELVVAVCHRLPHHNS